MYFQNVATKRSFSGQESNPVCKITRQPSYQGQTSVNQWFLFWFIVKYGFCKSIRGMMYGIIGLTQVIVLRNFNRQDTLCPDVISFMSAGPSAGLPNFCNLAWHPKNADLQYAKYTVEYYIYQREGDMGEYRGLILSSCQRNMGRLWHRVVVPARLPSMQPCRPVRQPNAMVDYFPQSWHEPPPYASWAENTIIIECTQESAHRQSTYSLVSECC